jgi:hypothetical protein
MIGCYINTYGPLVSTRAGREASCEYNLPPFIDGSIRREPDLEHRYPSISCLCRTDKFAPRLELADIVAYLTKKARYGKEQAHRRLTAVLKVYRVLPTHLDAAHWYRAKGESLPVNCCVPGNRPKAYEHSNRIFSGLACVPQSRIRQQWDKEYRYRASTFPTFVVCKPLFRELRWNAPIVTDSNLIKAFGCVPGTQNPGKLDPKRFVRWLKQYGVHVQLPDQ